MRFLPRRKRSRRCAWRGVLRSTGAAGARAALSLYNLHVVVAGEGARGVRPGPDLDRFGVDLIVSLGTTMYRDRLKSMLQVA